MPDFRLVAPFEPTGDQPQAIDKLSDVDLKFLADETNTDLAFVKAALGI